MHVSIEKWSLGPSSVTDFVGDRYSQLYGEID